MMRCFLFVVLTSCFVSVEAALRGLHEAEPILKGDTRILAKTQLGQSILHLRPRPISLVVNRKSPVKPNVMLSSSDSTKWTKGFVITQQYSSSSCSGSFSAHAIPIGVCVPDFYSGNSLIIESVTISDGLFTAKIKSFSDTQCTTDKVVTFPSLPTNCTATDGYYYDDFLNPYTYIYSVAGNIPKFFDYGVLYREFADSYTCGTGTDMLSVSWFPGGTCQEEVIGQNYANGTHTAFLGSANLTACQPAPTAEDTPGIQIFVSYYASGSSDPTCQGTPIELNFTNPICGEDYGMISALSCTGEYEW